jgi:hypothetical protein
MYQLITDVKGENQSISYVNDIVATCGSHKFSPEAQPLLPLWCNKAGLLGIVSKNCKGRFKCVDEEREFFRNAKAARDSEGA